MPIPLTAAQAKAVSTNSNIKYLWSVFLEECTDPVLGSWVDPLSVDIHILQSAKKNTTPVQWTSNQKITTLSQQLYGTTSLWAVILYLNGYMHPDEIPAGATLLVPTLDSVDSILAVTNPASTNYGKTFKV